MESFNVIKFRCLDYKSLKDCESLKKSNFIIGINMLLNLIYFINIIFIFRFTYYLKPAPYNSNTAIIEILIYLVIIGILNLLNAKIRERS